MLGSGFRAQGSPAKKSDGSPAVLNKLLSVPASLGEGTPCKVNFILHDAPDFLQSTPQQGRNMSIPIT